MDIQDIKDIVIKIQKLSFRELKSSDSKISKNLKKYNINDLKEIKIMTNTGEDFNYDNFDNAEIDKKFIEIKQELLDSQEALYIEYISNEHQKLKDNDPIVFSIRSSKLFRLEFLLHQRMINYLCENDTRIKFKMAIEPYLLEDIFSNFDVLRNASRLRSNISNKHQFGLFYFNNFLCLTNYSRPKTFEVENSIKHFDCSRIFNFNINSKKEFENKEDVENFIIVTPLLLKILS